MMTVANQRAIENAPDSIALCLRAVAENPTNCELRMSLANHLMENEKFAAAAANYRKAVALCPDHAIARERLKMALKAETGECREEVARYQRQLQLARSRQFKRATELVQRGLFDKSFSLWQAIAIFDPGSLKMLDQSITDCMYAGDTERAGEYARIYAAILMGSEWYPRGRNPELPILQLRATALSLSVPKLMHDIEQFTYLRSRQLIGEEFATVTQEYQRVADRLRARGADAREMLGEENRHAIGKTYNRIVHLHRAPQVKRALSGSWNGAEVERRYFDNPPGIVVVDDLLSPEALSGLRTFCLESTVWSTSHYAGGRLGSFFRDGFNCPLLIQVEEELRQALSRLIGSRHRLRQMWGFKYESSLPVDTIHADFAAVNVNFWITQDSANLDKNTGGMIIYNVRAPQDWDFDTYNKRGDLIMAFLARENARPIEIPYRENRAVIFNSDLFHRTATLNFRPGYVNRRVNITMLYGDRENVIDDV